MASSERHEERSVQSTFTCGCKGVRTCLVCEGSKLVDLPRRGLSEKWEHTYELSLARNGLIRVGNSHAEQEDDHVEVLDCSAVDFDGIQVIEMFVTPEEESEIVQYIDANPWKDSQSGRRKQAS